MGGKKQTKRMFRPLFSYEEYFLSFSDAEFLERIQEIRELNGLKESLDLFSQIDSFSKDKVMQQFLKDFVSVSCITRCISELNEKEKQFIFDCMSIGGAFSLQKEPLLNKFDVEDLEKRGLVFIVSIKGEEYLFIPLEIFFVASTIFSFRNHRSLCYHLYCDYTAASVRSIANANQINLFQNHKLAVASKVYQFIVDNKKQTIHSFSDDEIKVLRWFFICQGGMTDDAFVRKSGTREQESRYYYDNALSQYIRSQDKYSYGKLNHYDLVLIDLINKGVLSLSKGEEYQSYDFFIPVDFWFEIEEIFMREIDAEKEVLEKKLYVSKPAKVLSYDARVADDLIKVQIAIFCGLLEITGKKTYKKKSFSNIMNLLSIDEIYLEALLSALSSVVQFTDQKCYMKKIHFNGLLILESFFKGDVFFARILPVLFSLSGWVDIKILAQYILRTRECYMFQQTLKERGLEEAICAWYPYGIIEISEDFKKVKPSLLLTKILGKSKVKEVPIIKAKDRPLIIQPNLELLIPYHIEFAVLKKIAQFSEVSIIDKMVHFNLTKNSLIKAFDSGWTLEKVKNFLTSISCTGIPAVVQKFLDSVGERQGEAVVFSCMTLVKCSGVMIREKIAAIKSLDTFVPEGQEGYLAIKNKDEYDVVQILKKKGIMAVASLEQKDAIGGASISERIEFYRKKKTRVCLTIRWAGGQENSFANAQIMKIERNTVRFRYELSDGYQQSEWTRLNQITDIYEEKSDAL